MTADRSKPPLTAARPARARLRWPGLLLALAMVLVPPAAARAGDPPPPLAPARDWSKEPLPASTPTPPPVPGQLRIHGGWYFQTSLALVGAVAGGTGGTSSLSELAGGQASVPFGFDLRGGYTLRPDFRLGLVVSLFGAEGTRDGLRTSATFGRLGGELSWHPRGDGPFVRGELGLGFLELFEEDVSSAVMTTDVAFSGPALTLGGGWLFGWHQFGVAHLFLGADLSWAHYRGSGGPGAQLDWSLSWALRVGLDLW